MLDGYRGVARLTLLGLAGGLLASLFVLAFHQAIDLGEQYLLPPGGSGNYEGLNALSRLLTPVVAGLVLGLAFDLLPRAVRQVGVVHVMNRLRSPGSERLPPANLAVQFIAAVTAVVGGHSMDKEGPSVHIGAASAHLVGFGIRLSTEEEFTLAACGGAAAIAAAFNTPLAGVIFVIEVLRIRYEITRFLPVIVASVVGAVIGQTLFHVGPQYPVPAASLQSNAELPYLLILGLITGLLASLFIGIAESLARHTRKLARTFAFALAGLITGCLALMTPEIMGTSKDAVSRLLNDPTLLVMVALLTLTKLVATATAVGLGVPGGLIGPTLLIGASAGSTLGLLFAMFDPAATAPASFYATVGMVAMMGATLRAPLSALTALLELTGNPNVILPGMLAVATAELTNRLATGKDSIFESLRKI